MAAGFIKFRRGLIDHLKDGRMSFPALALFAWLLLHADYESSEVEISVTGIMKAADWSRGKSYRTLRALVTGGYLTLIAEGHKSGSRYRINKMRNAKRNATWNASGTLEPAAKAKDKPTKKRKRNATWNASRTPSDFLPSPSEVIEKREGAGAGAPAHAYKDLVELWQKIFVHCTESKPTWIAAHFASLKRLIKAHGGDVVAERMKQYGRRWAADPFYKSQGLDFLAFVKHFDRLATWSKDQVRTGATATTAEASAAWAKVLTQAAAVGRDGTPDIDERTYAAVRKAGGFAAVCRADPQRIKTMRNAFMDAWKEDGR